MLIVIVAAVSLFAGFYVFSVFKRSQSAYEEHEAIKETLKTNDKHHRLKLIVDFIRLPNLIWIFLCTADVIFLYFEF